MVRKLCIVSLLIAMSLCFVSAVYAEVQTHGFVLARTILTNNEYTSRIERYGIKFTEKIDDEFDWVTEIYIHPQVGVAAGRLYLESAYLNWHLKERVPWDFTVRIGRGRNFCYGITPSYRSRRTSDYSLYSESFTQMRVVGFQTFSNFGENIQLALALINPYSFASRALPDFPIGDNIPIPVCDRDTESSTFDRVALSGRLGYKYSMLNAGANVYISDPKEGINSAKSRFGFDAELKCEKGFLAQAQFTAATTQVTALADDLSHMGGEFLAGWEPGKLGLYARYGMVSFDDEFQSLNSIMVSGVYKIHPRIHLRLECLVNGEETDDAKGWAEVDNDVIFFETLFAW